MLARLLAWPGRPPDSVELGSNALWHGALVAHPNRDRGVYALVYDDGGVYNSQNGISKWAPRPAPPEVGSLAVLS